MPVVTSSAPPSPLACCVAASGGGAPSALKPVSSSAKLSLPPLPVLVEPDVLAVAAVMPECMPRAAPVWRDAEDRTAACNRGDRGENKQRIG